MPKIKLELQFDENEEDHARAVLSLHLYLSVLGSLSNELCDFREKEFDSTDDAIEYICDRFANIIEEHNLPIVWCS